MALSKEKKQLSVRLRGNDADEINDFIDIYEVENNSDLKTDRQIFTALLDAALNQKEPVKALEALKTENKRLQDENTSFQTENNALQTENTELKTELSGLKTENESLKTEINELQQKLTGQEQIINKEVERKTEIETSLQKELNRLKEQLDQKESELQAKQLSESEFTVKLNKFQKELMDKYINNKNVINKFNESNQGGKMDGFQDRINTPDMKQNRANFLKNVFIGSAFGKQLMDIGLNRKQIFTAFEKLKQQEKQANEDK